MLLAVERDEAADQVRLAPGQHLHAGVAVTGGVEGRLVAVVEDVGLPLDLLDVGVAGHHPERVRAFDLGQPQRQLGAQPGQRGINPLALRIGVRVDHRGGQLGGDAGRGRQGGHGMSPRLAAPGAGLAG